MATSGTITFTMTRDQIISYALRKIGVLEVGATPDATTVTNCAQALDMMIKSWVNKGIKLWTLEELTLPLVASTTSYVIGPVGTTPSPVLVADKPMRLMQAWLRNVSVTPSNDIPLQVISQQQYNLFGSKFSTGTSNSVYMQVGRDNSTLYTYLTPDTTASTLYQMHLLIQRGIQDAGVASNNVDFPAEWLYSLGWNLAAELATDFGVDTERLTYIETKAGMFKMEAEDFDVEYNSITLAPDTRYNKR
jgi:hypothetical protein